jgi:hypothetical protein
LEIGNNERRDSVIYISQIENCDRFNAPPALLPPRQKLNDYGYDRDPN